MKKILLIQTGGTIAMQMKKGRHGMVAAEFDMDKVHQQIPEISQIAEITSHPIFFEDSSDLNPTHWKLLADCVSTHYNDYDGFVILHGTDTMAYTASALSFAFENLSKPVIFTGSQVPLSNIRSDALRNLINAVELATLPFLDVAICFNDHLYRANRSTKISIDDFDAFASPNFHHLAEIGVSLTVNQKYDLPFDSFESNPEFDNRVHLIKLFPGLRPEYLPEPDITKVRAIIIEAFGSGNFPTKGDFNLLPYIERCSENEISVIMASQTVYDSVDLTKYEGGRKAAELGAISTKNMTTEACITKAMYLLARCKTYREFNSAFTESIRGEL